MSEKEYQQEDIEQMIRTILAEETDMNPDDIKPEMTLGHDLDMDRNSIEQVLVACEVEFGVQYEPEDAADIQTVQDLINSVSEW